MQPRSVTRIEQTVSENLHRVVAIDLTVPGVEEMHRRAGEKWAAYDADVLSATIAEMDFPLAPPVVEALRGAIDRGDLDYSAPARSTLRDAFARFAARRLQWTVDEEQISLVPDVMLGLVELCRVIAAPGQSVAFATPAYPPFFSMLPTAGVKLIEIALDPDGSLDLEGLDAALAAGARALVLANPHNPTGRALAREELEAIADRCAEREAWVLADEIHAPLALPGATHVPWLDAVIAQLAANRDQLGRDLAQRLPAIAWRPPQATYLAWLDCTGLGLGDEPAEVFLTEGRVALGRGLDYGAPGAGHVRLNFATSPEHLTDAVARMARALPGS